MFKVASSYKYIAVLLSLTLTASVLAEGTNDKFRSFAFYLPPTAKILAPNPIAKKNGLVSSAILRVSLDKLHSKTFSALAFGAPLYGLKDLNRRGSAGGSYIRQNSNTTVKVSVGQLRRAGKSEAVGDYRIATVYNSRKKSTGVYAIFELDSDVITLLGRTTVNNNNLKIERWKRDKIVSPGCQTDEIQSQISASSKVSLPFTLIDSGSIKEVSLLTAYTPGVLKELESEDAISAQIAFKISEANEIFENSNIPVVLKLDCPPHALVGDGYESAGATNVALTKGDGIWDELHQLRTDCKADLVHVFEAGTWGAGKIPESPVPAYPSQTLGRFGFGCSVMKAGYNGGFAHFAHEIGHNFGAGHDSATLAPGADPNKLGFFPTSHGHRFIGADNKTYYTTMTYGKAGEYYTMSFSDPNILYQGVPTGTQSNNNSGTIRFLAETVSQYGENISYPEGISISVELRKTFENAKATLHTTISGDLAQPVLQREHLIAWNKLDNGQLSSINDVLVPGSVNSASFDSPLDFKGTYFASLDPDRDVRSNEVTNPNWSNVTLTLQNQGMVLNGTVNYQVTPNPEVKGDWIGIYSAPYGTSDYTLIGTTNVVNGVFTYTVTQPALYKAGYTRSSGIKFSDSVIVF